MRLICCSAIVWCECLCYGFDYTQSIRTEIRAERGLVQLACFTICLVEDILSSQTEARRLAVLEQLV